MTAFEHFRKLAESGFAGRDTGAPAGSKSKTIDLPAEAVKKPAPVEKAPAPAAPAPQAPAPAPHQPSAPSSLARSTALARAGGRVRGLSPMAQMALAGGAGLLGGGIIGATTANPDEGDSRIGRSIGLGAAGLGIGAGAAALAHGIPYALRMRRPGLPSGI